MKRPERPVFAHLGAVMTMLGAAAFGLGALGAADTVIALVAGVGSGAAMLTAVGGALAGHRRAVRDG